MNFTQNLKLYFQNFKLRSKLLQLILLKGVFIKNEIKIKNRIFQIKEYNKEINQILINDITYGQNGNGYWKTIKTFFDEIKIKNPIITYDELSIEVFTNFKDYNCLM